MLKYIFTVISSTLIALTQLALQNINTINHCDPNLPYLGIGDFNLTERNHDLKLSKHENILIYVSADLSLCPQCCRAESILKEI